MHGAKAGPPASNRNAWKHGGRSAEVLALRREARTLLDSLRHLTEELG